MSGVVYPKKGVSIFRGKCPPMTPSLFSLLFLYVIYKIMADSDPSSGNKRRRNENENKNENYENYEIKHDSKRWRVEEEESKKTLPERVEEKEKTLPERVEESEILKANEAIEKPDDIEKAKKLIEKGRPVIFLVGRMNPPTPGHIYLIRTLIEKALELKAIPRAYITLTHNEEKIKKLKKKPEPIMYINKNPNTKNKTRAYVKHKNYENPLSPAEKEKFIKKMTINQGILSEEQANEVIVIDKYCNGIYNALKCAKIEFLKMNGIDLDDTMRNDLNRLIESKLYFLMGEEEDPAEQAQRNKYCDKSEYNVNCIFIEREKPKGENGAEVKSMSGSKIRLLAAGQNPDYEKVIEFYNGFLNREDAKELIQAIRIGVDLKNPILFGGKKTRKIKKTQTKKQTKKINKKNKQKNSNKKLKQKTQTKETKKLKKKQTKKQTKKNKKTKMKSFKNKDFFQKV